MLANIQGIETHFLIYFHKKKNVQLCLTIAFISIFPCGIILRPCVSHSHAHNTAKIGILWANK